MEISISIEETNKLRQQLGLRPIPVTGTSSGAEQPSVKTSGERAEKSGQTASGGELSIEETNKLRKSLGLKPIAAVESSEAQEVQNQRQYEQELRKEKKEDEIKARIEEAKYHSNKLLLGKTLLDSYEEESTDSWLDNLGKTAAAVKKHKPVEQPKSLSGVKLSHGKNLDDLQENDIFTFEDNGIAGDGDDVLVNERLENKQKVERDLEEKQKVNEIKNGIFYKPQQDVKPDVEHSEIKDGNIIAQRPQPSSSADDEPAVAKRKVVEGLFDDFEEAPKPKVSMKKLKKRTEKPKNKRVLVADDEIELKSVELAPVDNIEEDIDLVLSEQRKRKQQKRSVMTPEEIAREVRRVAREKEQEELEARAMVSEGITFDSTSDFINSLKVDLLHNNTASESQAAVKREHQDGPVKLDDAQEDTTEPTAEPAVSFSTGVAETLKFLKSKDIIKETNSSAGARQAQRQSELLKLRISIEERILKESLENDRQFTSLTKEEQSKILADKLDEIIYRKGIVASTAHDYKPDVKLTYRDDSGRKLTTKQAFKFMSHKFHGTKGKKK